MDEDLDGMQGRQTTLYQDNITRDRCHFHRGVIHSSDNSLPYDIKASLDVHIGLIEQHRFSSFVHCNVHIHCATGLLDSASAANSSS